MSCGLSAKLGTRRAKGHDMSPSQTHGPKSSLAMILVVGGGVGLLVSGVRVASIAARDDSTGNDWLLFSAVVAAGVVAGAIEGVVLRRRVSRSPAGTSPLGHGGGISIAFPSAFIGAVMSGTLTDWQDALFIGFGCATLLV